MKVREETLYSFSIPFKCLSHIEVQLINQLIYLITYRFSLLLFPFSLHQQLLTKEVIKVSNMVMLLLMVTKLPKDIMTAMLSFINSLILLLKTFTILTTENKSIMLQQFILPMAQLTKFQ